MSSRGAGSATLTSMPGSRREGVVAPGVLTGEGGAHVVGYCNHDTVSMTIDRAWGRGGRPRGYPLGRWN